MTEKIKFDMAKFKSLKSIKGHFSDGQGGCCVMGKLLVSIGALAPNQSTKDTPFASLAAFNKAYNLYGPMYSTVVSKNNSGFFEEADAELLQWVIESGKFEIINAEQETCEASASAQQLEPVGSQVTEGEAVGLGV